MEYTKTVTPEQLSAAKVVIFGRGGVYAGPVPSDWPTTGIAVRELLRIGDAMFLVCFDLSRPESGGYAIPPGLSRFFGRNNCHYQWTVPDGQGTETYTLGLRVKEDGALKRFSLEDEHGLHGGLTMVLNSAKTTAYVAGRQRSGWAVSVIRLQDRDTWRWQESFKAGSLGPVTHLIAEGEAVAWAMNGGTEVYCRVPGKNPWCTTVRSGVEVGSICIDGHYVSVQVISGGTATGSPMNIPLY